MKADSVRQRYEKITPGMEMLGITFLLSNPTIGRIAGAKMGLPVSREPLVGFLDYQAESECRDNHQRLCFALSLWNGKDPILKERLYGLNGSQGTFTFQGWL